ncbi:MAG: putative molybdenum carrier protein [Gammaproteobacteria bacterium]|nr:putative molybdenum carrier protein [Gammaproteobacteria bacterium]
MSGGQTGVDRAALDVALELNIPCGGWCPKGRRAEDGMIPLRYPLRETASIEYECRNEWNVRDSDASLILICGELEGGTALTVEFAKNWGRPYLVVDLDGQCEPQRIRGWLERHRIRSLNVAGPRESKVPGINQHAAAFLRKVLQW